MSSHPSSPKSCRKIIRNVKILHPVRFLEQHEFARSQQPTLPQQGRKIEIHIHSLSEAINLPEAEAMLKTITSAVSKMNWHCLPSIDIAHPF